MCNIDTVVSYKLR